MDLPKVEGTQIRGRIYHLNLRIKPEIQDLYGGKSHLRGSLRTSDPLVAEREVRRRRAELLEKEHERARQAEVEDIVAQLSPEKRAAYDAAGGLEGLLEGFERQHGDSDPTVDHIAPLPPAGAVHRGVDVAADQMAEAGPRSDDEVLADRNDDDWPVGSGGGALAVVDEEDDEDGLFTLADLLGEYEPNLAPEAAAALRHVVRLFTEFHGDIAFDELTVGHLDEFADAAQGLPADMAARLADGTTVRDLPFAELVAWTVHADAKPISETTRFQYVAILKELMAFGVPQHRRGDPWSDYRLQIKRREIAEETPRRSGNRFSPSEWTLSGAVTRLLELTILLFILAVLYLLWEARS